jgi:ribonuclease-3
MHDSDQLQKIIGVVFKDPQLLEMALTHRSFLNEHRKGKVVHNERLEFLGDAVLELAVTEFLYNNYPDPEGVLTNWRSALVKTDSLAETAAEIGLEGYIKLSRGEARNSARARTQIMANTVEAVIGAIYLDQGYTTAANFIAKYINKKLPDIIQAGSWQDAKTKLQEMMQEKEGVTPTYKVLEEDGPDHNKQFTVGVYVGKELRGQGSGASKQAAQQAAAENALGA